MMQYVRLNHLIFIGLSCLGFISCDLVEPKSESRSPSKVSKDDGESGPGSLKVETKGELIVQDLENSLTEAGVSQHQTSVIVGEATGSLAIDDSADLHLSGKADPNNLNEAVPAITGAVIMALGIKEIGLTDMSLKTKLAQIISQTIMQSLKNKLDGLSEDDQIALPSKILESGLSSLDEGGFTNSHLETSLSNFVSGVVGSLNKSGIKTKHSSKVLNLIGTSGVRSLKNSGVETRKLPRMIKRFAQSSVGSFKQGGIKKSEVAASLNGFVSGSVRSFDEIGFGTPVKAQRAMANIMEGSVTSLAQTELSESEQISEAINQSISGALDGLKQEEFKSSEIGIVVDDMMNAVVHSFEEITNTTATSVGDLQSITVAMSKHTISHFNKIELTDSQSLKAASHAVATGIMSGYGQLSSSILSKDEVSHAVEVVTQASVESLYQYHENIEDFGDFSTGFTGGVLDGLARGGYSQSDLTSVNDIINSGYEKALEDKGIDESSVERYKSDVSSNNIEFVSNMNQHCDSKNGTWDSISEVCSYPSVDTIETEASEVEEKECLDKGGVILYHADGAWFCDTADCSSDTFPDLLAENILMGVQIGGIEGTAELFNYPFCTETLTENCITTSDYPAVDTLELADKLGTDQELLGFKGEESVTASNCSIEGEVSCISNENFKSASVSGLSTKVISGQSVAGVSGIATVSTIQEDDCSSDGQESCLATSVYKAAQSAGLAAKVVSGQSVGGVVGTVQEEVGHQDCTGAKQSGCVATSIYRTMDLSSADDGNALDLTSSNFNTSLADNSLFEYWDENGARQTNFGDADLIASNLFKDVEVFAITGTAQTGTPPNCDSIGEAGTWILVPGDRDYGTNDFCVMKYEAKNNGSNIPVSKAPEVPWVNISQLDAKTKCASLGKGYHLITNDEWMTIASNIAGQGANWSGGTVGTGEMTRGHSNNSPGSGCAADENDNSAYVQTDCTGTSSGTFNQRRTHILSNGKVIWDIAGNVWEWTSYYIINHKPHTGTTFGDFPENGTQVIELSDLIPTDKSFWNISWNRDQSIGMIKGGSNGSGGALARGGGFVSVQISGLFSAAMDVAPAANNGNHNGFRCAVAVAP